MTPLQPHDSLECLTFLGNDRLAAGGWDGQLRVWSLPDGVCELTLGEALDKPTTLVFSMSKGGVTGAVAWGSRLVSFRGGTLRVHEGETCLGEYHGETATWHRALYDAGLEPHVWPVRPIGDYVALHPDGVHLVEAGLNGDAHVWNLTNGECVQQISTRGPIALHPSGRYLLANGHRTADLFQIYTGERVQQLALPEDTSPQSLAFTPDGRGVVLGDWHGLTFYDLASGQSGARCPVEDGAVNDLAWHPGGDWLVGACNAGALVVWDARTLEPLARHVLEGQWRCVEISPDGHRVAWAGSAGAFWCPWERLFTPR